MNKAQSLISILLAVIAAYVAHASGLWVALGAHPNWSQSATYIGAPIAALIYIGLNFAVIKLQPKTTFVVLSLVAVVILTFVITTLGKREFVNSYAENDLAGLLWFYGFIVFVASLIAATAVGVDKALDKIKGA